MGEVVLFPHIQQQIEEVVERTDEVIEFVRRDMARKDFNQYKGETTTAVCFGGSAMNLLPQPCVVCRRVMGWKIPENGHIFYRSTNGAAAYLCIDCNRRYWNDRNENVPA